MNKHFKTAFNLASGVLAAKFVWDWIGAWSQAIHCVAERLYTKFLKEQAADGNETAINACELLNLSYKPGNFKTKEPIGFRKE